MLNRFAGLGFVSCIAAVIFLTASPAMAAPPVVLDSFVQLQTNSDGTVRVNPNITVEDTDGIDTLTVTVERTSVFGPFALTPSNYLSPNDSPTQESFRGFFASGAIPVADRSGSYTFNVFDGTTTVSETTALPSGLTPLPTVGPVTIDTSTGFLTPTVSADPVPGATHYRLLILNDSDLTLQSFDGVSGSEMSDTPVFEIAPGVLEPDKNYRIRFEAYDNAIRGDANLSARSVDMEYITANAGFVSLVRNFQGEIVDEFDACVVQLKPRPGVTQRITIVLKRGEHPRISWFINYFKCKEFVRKSRSLHSKKHFFSFFSKFGKRTFLLFPGGRNEHVTSDGSRSYQVSNNYLLRILQTITDEGITPVIFSLPSDLGGTISDEFRTSDEHAEDVSAIVRYLKYVGLGKVFLTGTSRGTLSIGSLALKVLKPEIKGTIFTSSIAGDPDLFNLPVENIAYPVLFVHNRDDECSITQFSDAVALFDRITLNPRRHFVEVQGAISPPLSGPCNGLSAHGFFGTEAEVAKAMTDWAKGLEPPALIEFTE